MTIVMVTIVKTSEGDNSDGRRKKRHYNRYKVLMASLVVLVRFNLFVYACV